VRTPDWQGPRYVRTRGAGGLLGVSDGEAPYPEDPVAADFSSALSEAVAGAAFRRAAEAERWCMEAYFLQDEGQEWRLQTIEQPTRLVRQVGDISEWHFEVSMPGVASDISDLVDVSANGDRKRTRDPEIAAEQGNA
jgi:hypothetical protein